MKKSLAELQAAAQNGGPDDWCELGRRYFAEGDDDNALIWLEKASASGHIMSMHALYRLHFIQQKPDKAVEVLDKLASQYKDPEGMVTLGHLYFTGGIGEREAAIKLVEDGIAAFGDISKIDWMVKNNAVSVLLDTKDSQVGFLGDIPRLKLGIQLQQSIIDNNKETIMKFGGGEEGWELAHKILDTAKDQLHYREKTIGHAKDAIESLQKLAEHLED